MGLLRLHVIRGVNLAIRDVSSSDPYVVVRMGKQVPCLTAYIIFFASGVFEVLFSSCGFASFVCEIKIHLNGVRSIGFRV